MNEQDIPTVTVDALPNPLPADVVILDVREQHEWADGHIDGATHIPLGELVDRHAELDPQVETVVICHSGGRSARATAWLIANGHQASNLDGGMIAWEEANRPIV